MKFASLVDQYNAFILNLFNHCSFDTPDAWQGNILYVVLQTSWPCSLLCFQMFRDREARIIQMRKEKMPVWKQLEWTLDMNDSH